MTSDDSKKKRSRKTPVAGAPTNEAEATLPPERPTPKPRKSRRTPVAGTATETAPSAETSDVAAATDDAKGDVATPPARDTGGQTKSDVAAAKDAKGDVATPPVPDAGVATPPVRDTGGQTKSDVAAAKDAKGDVATPPARDTGVATSAARDAGVATPAARDAEAKADVATPPTPDATSAARDAGVEAKADVTTPAARDAGVPKESDVAAAKGAEAKSDAPPTAPALSKTPPLSTVAPLSALPNLSTASEASAPIAASAVEAKVAPKTVGVESGAGSSVASKDVDVVEKPVVDTRGARDDVSGPPAREDASKPPASNDVGSFARRDASESPARGDALAREDVSERPGRAGTIRAPLPRDSNAALEGPDARRGDVDAKPDTKRGDVDAKPDAKRGDVDAKRDDVDAKFDKPSDGAKGDATPEPVYDDPELAAMPAFEAVGDISSIGLPAGASGQMQAMQLPNPAAAAFEAARIAEKIVGGNIDTASGAAIVAAAAAGAAIEAVRMRALAGETEAPVPPVGQEPPSNVDPVTTVRMQRERVLRALAADVAANAATSVAAEQAAAAGVGGAEARTRAPSQPGYPRAPTSPGVDDGHDELDPVQIAALAIQKLRQRASTDFAELRGHAGRLDIVVLVLALMIIILAGWWHGRLVTPPTKEFAVRGLVFEHSSTWLEPEEVPPSPPRIIRDPTGQPPKKGNAYHVEYTNSLDPNARLEVFIDKKPAWSNIVTGLELDRRTRYGELYTLDDSRIRSVEDQDWLRTEYRYAHAVSKGDAPRVSRAIEYATIDREQIYVVTMFGSNEQLEQIEGVIAPTLRVPTRSGLPLVPQTRSLGQRTYPNQVARAFDSTVMVVMADLVDGRLKARGGGSGVIVGGDGSVLTNYHVIHDKDGRLHDVFVIGRFSTLDRAPQLQCAGRPSRSKLQRELDLALIKCDLDLDGRTWQPALGQIWPVLPEARSSDIKMGQRVWVLGYPDAGGGGLTLSEGAVEGWTGQDGTQGRDFIKTDASITHGNSGGPVVDDSGRLIGIAAASRTKVTQTGTVVEVSQVGLVRPLPTASDLLAIAAAGWTPREGHTEVEIQPSAVEAPSEGVRIATKVLDAANESPVRDALVLVLRPGVKASTIDVNRLDDQTLAWGRSNTLGDVALKQPVPVPGTYTVMVIARGYEPLIGEGALKLTDKTPAAFDPWGQIKLMAR